MKSSGIGGQAVLEGIMMRYKNDIAVAVRKPDGNIAVGKRKLTNPKDKYPVLGLPVLRGVVSFVSSLITGIDTLMFSANFFVEDEAPASESEVSDEIKAAESEDKIEKQKKAKKEEKDKKENEGFSTAAMFGTVAFSLVVAIAIFMVLPYFASAGIMKLVHSESDALLAVVEGVIKLAVFVGYIAAISCMSDIKRTFMYHGSEHKCISCIESGKLLTVDNVMASSKEHRRCGTSFIFFVLFISIIFFIFLRFDSMLLKVVVRLLLLPVIAGVSYEFIQWAGNSDTKLACYLSKPGLWIQKITTREPDRDMVEVAICSVEAVFDWKQYLREQGIDVPENFDQNVVFEIIDRDKDSQSSDENESCEEE